MLNRSSTLSVKDITLEEVWSNMKPPVHNIKVFGCLTYAHGPNVPIKKIDPK